MSFLDPKERIMDIILTQEGRRLLSQGNLQVKYYRFFDDEVDYQIETSSESDIGSIPSNTSPVSIAGTIGIGDSISITPGVWTGTPLLTYTLRRDGVAVGSLTNVSEATIEAYVLTADDIGPVIDVLESDSVSATSVDSNNLVYDDVLRLPTVAIGVSTEGITLVGGETDLWASAYGGLSVTLTASSAAARPAYNATAGVGSRPLVTGDGVDDVMFGDVLKGSVWSDYEMGIAGQRVALGTAGDGAIVFASTTNTTQAHISDNNAVSLRFAVISGATTVGTSDPDANNSIWSGDAASDGTQNIRRNGTVEATSASTTTSRSDPARIAIFGRPGLSNYGNFAIQAWFIGGLMTSTQRSECFALIKYLTGIG